MLFFAKFVNNQFDEASSYHIKQFKLHVAVKEIGKFRMYVWRKETRLKALVFTSVDKLENSECRNI